MAIALFVLWFCLIGLGPITAALHVRRGRLYGFGLPILAALALLLIERIWIAIGWPLEQGDLALPYLIGLGLLGPAVGEGLRLRLDATRVMISAVGLTVAMRFLFCAAMANVAAFYGLQPIEWGLLWAEGTDPLLGILIGMQGLLPASGAAVDTETGAQLLRFTGALLAQNVALAAIITLIGARHVLAREGWQLSLERLDRWRSPEPLIFAAIVAAALALLGPKGFWADLGINLFLVGMVPYIFQGLAILSFWFVRLRIAGWLKALLLAMIIIQPVTIVVLAAAGVGDLWFDLRRMSRKAEDDELDDGSDDDDQPDRDSLDDR
ncbi:MAG: DUF2232 domain-containing protein [Candidatus Alcyoniella australis]|nr:DUF2232 domain-containing protein [Candidatus Alcyoniella australis]